MRIDAFAARVREHAAGGGGGAYHYLQTSLVDGVGDEMLADFRAFDWPWLLEWQRRLGWEELTSNLLLVGERGNATPAHYDEQQNLFAQLSGRKRCVLFSPADYRCLYPYPLNHPMDRQTQARRRARRGATPAPRRAAPPPFRPRARGPPRPALPRPASAFAPAGPRPGRGPPRTGTRLLRPLGRWTCTRRTWRASRASPRRRGSRRCLRRYARPRLKPAHYGRGAAPGLRLRRPRRAAGQGELLYIPQYWFHHIENLDDECVSLNFWSAPRPRTRAALAGGRHAPACTAAQVQGPGDEPLARAAADRGAAPRDAPQHREASRG